MDILRPEGLSDLIPENTQAKEPWAAISELIQ